MDEFGETISEVETHFYGGEICENIQALQICGEDALSLQEISLSEDCFYLE